MSTSEPAERQPVPPSPPTGTDTNPVTGTGGWGQPTQGTPGYGQVPEPRYGQYAPGPQAASPAAPHHGAPHGGVGEYGQAQYGTPAGGPPPPGMQGSYATLAQKPGVIPLRPLTLGEIFDGAFGAIRHNPRVMLGLSTLVIAVATVIGTLFGYLVSGYIVPALPAELSSDQESVDLIAMLASTLGVSLVLTIASPVVNGLLIGSIGQSVIGRKITVPALWAQVRRRVWALLGFTLLLTAAMFLVVALYVLVIVAAMQTVGVGVSVLTWFVGTIGLVIVFSWVSIRTLLVPPALVLEEQGFWTSIRRGWLLSRGSFWRLLGIYLLASIAVGIISSMLSVPFGIISALAIEAGSEAVSLVITGIGTILTGVLSAAFTAGVVSLLYIDVRMRREGLDVELSATANDPDQVWDR